MSPTHLMDDLPNQSIAFPLRLRQGLLLKAEERESYLTLVEIMARTPRGSWGGHPSFGFHEFFSEVVKDGLSPESRKRLAEATVKEINAVLADLGLTRYQADSLLLEPLEKETRGDGNPQWMRHAMEKRGVTLMLRESRSDRTVKYAL